MTTTPLWFHRLLILLYCALASWQHTIQNLKTLNTAGDLCSSSRAVIKKKIKNQFFCTGVLLLTPVSVKSQLSIWASVGLLLSRSWISLKCLGWKCH